MDRSSSKKSICGSIISLEKKSLIEFFQKNVPSSTLHSNSSNTNLSTTYSTPNRWDNIAGISYHPNERGDIIIHSTNSATINLVHITKIYPLHMFHHGNQLTNMKKIHQMKIKLIIENKNQKLFAIFNQVNNKKETVYR